MSAVLGIVGTGLIGGSIGMRARQNGMTVLGMDCSVEVEHLASERGAIDRLVSRDELYESADQIVLAIPVMQCVQEVRQIARGKPKASLIIDVTSVKAPIVEAAQGIDQFVGTHPMAGSEDSGPGAARSDLFAGRTWAYTPVESPDLRNRVLAFIESMGATPLPMEAQRHDAIAAFTSHMPQLFATLFSQELSQRDDESMQLCGPVARELQRLGRSRLAVWRDIFESNHANISVELRAMAALLQQTAADLDARDFRSIERAFKA